METCCNSTLIPLCLSAVSALAGMEMPTLTTRYGAVPTSFRQVISCATKSGLTQTHLLSRLALMLSAQMERLCATSIVPVEVQLALLLASPLTRTASGVIQEATSQALPTIS